MCASARRPQLCADSTSEILTIISRGGQRGLMGAAAKERLTKNKHITVTAQRTRRTRSTPPRSFVRAQHSIIQYIRVVSLALLPHVICDMRARGNYIHKTNISTRTRCAFACGFACARTNLVGGRGGGARGTVAIFSAVRTTHAHIRQYMLGVRVRYVVVAGYLNAFSCVRVWRSRGFSVCSFSLSLGWEDASVFVLCVRNERPRCDPHGWVTH